MIMRWMQLVGLGLALSLATPAVAEDEEVEDDVEESGDRTWGDYLRMALTFQGEVRAEEVRKKMVGAWVLGALLSGYGAHVWAPMLFFDDAPENAAKSAATTLGIISIFTSYLELGVVCFMPCIWVPFLGWLTFFIVFVGLFAVAGFINWYVMPRAIMLAYSDAYEQGGGTGRKKKRRGRDDDDDDEAEEEDDDEGGGVERPDISPN